ncbi:MAG: hypothetical protein EBE86_006055 [Hormoscilla sp. GUM202]|nr:hypothetical protein [Hormoscilla sp. GUM202]
MSYRVSIQLEQTEDGYSAYSPELAVGKFQGSSVDRVFDDLKEAVKLDLKKLEEKANNSLEEKANNSSAHSILKLFEDVVKDMTEEELSQLPTDGAEQHDHYIYGTPKRT